MLLLLLASGATSFAIASEYLPSIYSLLLSTDKVVLTYPSTTTLTQRPTDNLVVKPEKGKSVLDDVYGTIITRVNKSDSAIAGYPKTQSWNQDMSLLRIGSRIYNADTLQESPITSGKTVSQAYQTLCSRSSDYFKWSNKNPNRFFVVDSAYQFIQGTINGENVDCSNVLDTFAEYEEIHIGPYEGNIDYNDKYLVFSAKKPNDSSYYIILFDIPNQLRVWTKTINDNIWVLDNGDWKPSQIDWVSISPSGNYIVTNEINKANYQEGLHRYNINYADAQKLQYDYQGTLYSEGGHGDMGFDIDSNEVLVQFMTGLGVHSFNLDKPEELGKKLLSSPYGGGHVSCRNSRRKGWCYISTHQAGYQQVFALRLDGTGNETVQSFSQSHIQANYPETYGAASPDGTLVIFNSNWDNLNGEVDTFIVRAQ